MSTLRERTQREVANERKRHAVAHATRSHYLNRIRQWAGLRERGLLQPLRDWARDAKDRVLSDHGRYLRQFTRAIESRGGRVHFAATSAEATAQIVAILKQRGARTVVKSKSMASEEIYLNPALEAAGIKPVETDLGEYIVQLRKEPPAHIVGPAIHLDRHDVSELFARELGQPMPTDPAALTAVAREVLREQFLQADAGITGGNFGIAESGSIVLVTNEGNGRMVTSLPKLMITLIGLEKLVATWADLEPFLTLLPRSSTGQNNTVYNSIITGPRQPGELDGPEELHVIILDAGRSNLLNTAYQDALRCIRCGACLNGCPVFRQIGGHGYGTTYGGPIGITITPLMQGPAKADLLDACSLCGACTEVCPVQIPLAHMIRDQKEDRTRSTAGGRMERLIFRAWAWVWSSPARYRGLARLLGLLARPFSRGGYLRWGPGPLGGWLAGRDFPAPAAEPLHQRWARLNQEVSRSAADK